MKTSLKCSTLLIWLISLACAFGQQPWITFGDPLKTGTFRGVGFERYSGLKVIAPDVTNRGGAVLHDASVLSKTGGGMMVGIAEPAPELRGKSFTLFYDSSRNDGSRVGIRISNKAYYINLFDWELQPIVAFVSSGHHGAVSISVGLRRYTVTLDDAFQERLLGLRFIQADMASDGTIASQDYLPQTASGVIYGAGERQFIAKHSEVEEAMATLKPLFESARAARNSYYVLTDAGEPFVFSTSGAKLVIQGRPYYLPWDKRDDEVVGNDALAARFKSSWPTLKRANPILFRAVERAFQAAALFRYVQRETPENWNSFAQNTSKLVVDVIPTPQHLELASLEKDSE